MSRRLVSIAPDAPIMTIGAVQIQSSGESFEIIESDDEAKPPHCVRAIVAESLVKQYPERWQIVDGAEVKELERMMTV